MTMRPLPLLLLSLLPLGLRAQRLTATSPDGQLLLTLAVEGGRATYSLDLDGQTVMPPSPLGLETDAGGFCEGLTLADSLRRTYTDDYTLSRAKTSAVHYEATELRATVANAHGRRMDIVFRLSNRALALRYELPAWEAKGGGHKMSVRVTSEATGFRMPQGATTFLCPQAEPMTGWKRTKPSYEEEYAYDAPVGTPSQYGHGFTFPCLFKTADEGAWMLVSETGTGPDYCGCHLSEADGEGTYRIAFPMAEENNGNGTVEPAFALPGATPWRTISVGKSLKAIVETTAPWDNVEPRYATTHSYAFGKGTWSWILWQDESINYEDQVRYVDLAHDMGFAFTLVDCGWDATMGREGIESLARYASSRGVSLVLWFSSSGWWNDIEQSPVNVMCDPVKRKQAMRWLESIGVKGIKVDFFGGDKQETLRLYDAILSDADDHGLFVIFHGCTLPRGWERMYPNYAGSEAVLASENIYFDQHFCDKEAENTATHPFIRNAVGCMEFGGSFLSHTLNRGDDASKAGRKRRTSDTHELAQAVLFQNPVQNFALAPENLRPAEEGGSPRLCLDFLSSVPTEWDETVFVDGYPGMYCVMARRNAETWYVAGNNATGDNLTLRLSLPMLREGTARLYRDNAKTGEPETTEVKVGKDGKVKVSMPDNGGFVIVQ